MGEGFDTMVVIFSFALALFPCIVWTDRKDFGDKRTFLSLGIMACVFFFLSRAPLAN